MTVAALAPVVADAAKKKVANRPKPTGAQKVILAEWVLVVAVILLAPLGREEDDDLSAGDWIRKASAACVLFIVLGLISAVGPRTARACVALGGLIALVLVIDQRSIFGRLATALTSAKGDAPPVAPSGGEGVDDSQVGGGDTGRQLHPWVSDQPDPGTGWNQTIPSNRPGLPRNTGGN